MAAWDLTTYAGLQAAIADTLNRQDLSNQIPGFIVLFEAKANRKLRVRDMQTRVQATTDDEFIPVPGDFRAPHSLQLQIGSNGGWTPKLDFVGEDEATDLRLKYSREGYQGPPKAYTIFGGAFEVIPAPVAGTPYSYDLKYYAGISPLAVSVNWLLTKAPDAYLYGACAEAAPYLKNDERIAVWGGLRDGTFDELELESERATRSQTRLRARPRGF